jgi:hypothetical protein
MSLTLKDAVNVTVEISPLSAPAKAFNLGLVIADSQDVQQERLRVYGSLQEIAEAGFVPASSVYRAASLYFAQNPAPDALAIGTTDDGESETQLEALTACRGGAADWYAFTFADAVPAADVAAIAAFVESSPNTVWFNQVTGSDYLNTLTALKAQGYMRTLSVYSSGADNVAAGIMGYAMGANSDTSPAYTLAYKPVTGASPEDLALADFNAIQDANGNVYVTQGSYYNVFRSGKMADGTAFDDVLYLDMLVSGIAAAVMDQLTTLSKVPQTEDGVNILTTAIETPCTEMVTKGYIAPGQWNSRKVLTLSPGDTLSKGYKIMSESVAGQSQADRDARIAPPIYVCVKTAGAIEHVNIGVVVNR